jgi:serine phosphatase RsbU (regulator of sigma subunit)
VLTDGVTEAMDPAGALYGRARLSELLRKAEDPGTTLGAVRQDLRRFTAGAEQVDDVTLLCVRYNG